MKTGIAIAFAFAVLAPAILFSSVAEAKVDRKHNMKPRGLYEYMIKSYKKDVIRCMDTRERCVDLRKK